MNSTVLMVVAVLMTGSADAPLRESERPLTPTLKFSLADRRETQGRVAKGIAMGAFTIAGLSTIAFIVGSIDNAMKCMVAGLGNLVFGAVRVGAAASGNDTGPINGFSARGNDYTPLLGAVAGGVLLGLASTFAGVLLSNEGAETRATAEAEQREAHEAWLREIAVRAEEQQATPPVPLPVPRAALTAPPLPAPRVDSSAPRKPLVHQP